MKTTSERVKKNSKGSVIEKTTITASSQNITSSTGDRNSNYGDSSSSITDDNQKDINMKFQYISESGKAALNSYRYQGSDGSFITPLFQPFWNSCVSLLPVTMAPNMVTFLGFLGVILHFYLTLSYAPDLDGSKVPTWVWFSNVALLFWYMTMDSIDGKQARRTSSSSPLGELFDHGCDALTTMMQSVTLTIACQLGGTFKGFITILFINCVFFFAIWEQYYTGILRFSALTGPTEALLTAMLFHLIPAVFGYQVWHIDLMQFISVDSLPAYIPKHLPLNDFVLYSTALMSLFTLIGNVQFVYMTDISKEEQSLKGSALRACFPFVYMTILWCIWMVYSPENLIEKYPALCFSFYGFLSAYIVTRLVLARVCHMRSEKFYVILVPMLPIVFHSFNNHFQIIKVRSPIQEIHAILFYWVFAVICYAHMVYSVINEICIFLCIKCFEIPDVRLKAKENNEDNNNNNNATDNNNSKKSKSRSPNGSKMGRNIEK